MKKVLVSTVIGAAVALSGTTLAADGAFKLGANQMDAVSAGAYAAAGGSAGIILFSHGAAVETQAWGKGDKVKAYSSQLAGCVGYACALAASSGSKAVSKDKKKRKHKKNRKYNRKHRRGNGAL